ncbi:hypothetical protein EYF80_024750 [Liparis tanakae]|uniref:Uncharacterized protein n=1 Tax=Liparis tanakae TaxID=230148 RepID=A0A4Z2HHC2_9TELE|nr:hypothetical protein EYF80_024750 [Liparis tanakae]
MERCVLSTLPAQALRSCTNTYKHTTNNQGHSTRGPHPHAFQASSGPVPGRQHHSQTLSGSTSSVREKTHTSLCANHPRLETFRSAMWKEFESGERGRMFTGGELQLTQEQRRKGKHEAKGQETCDTLTCTLITANYGPLKKT